MPQDRFGLPGRVAIVTGAGKGIGAAVALTLADAGADSLVVARTGADLESVAEEVRSAGAGASPSPGTSTISTFSPRSSSGR